MRTVSTPRPPVKTITGSVRWLTSEPALALKHEMVAGLLIRRSDEPASSPGTAYMVGLFRDGGIVTGYRLEKLDGSDDAYDIDAGFRPAPAATTPTASGPASTCWGSAPP
jgi:hypothetical protein